MMVAEIKDTVVPKEWLPLIILHRLSVDYYGGGITVLELRRFLEPRLKGGLWTRSGVMAWIRNAEGWKRLWDQKDPDHVPRLLEEYHSIRLIV